MGREEKFVRIVIGILDKPRRGSGNGGGRGNRGWGKRAEKKWR